MIVLYIQVMDGWHRLMFEIDGRYYVFNYFDPHGYVLGQTHVVSKDIKL